MLGIDKAYALRDNPFTLEGLPIEIDNDLRDLLVTAPLQIAREERLLPYYCDDIYSKQSWNWTPSSRSNMRCVIGGTAITQDLGSQGEISHCTDPRTAGTEKLPLPTA